MANSVPGELEPWSHLQNKVVLVTGASSGLGLDFCLDLAKAGCRIVAAARRVDRLKSLCDEINNLPSPSSTMDDKQNTGPRAVAVELDVCADEQTIDRSIQRGWDAFGRIDALINNAGVRGSVKTPVDLTEEEWDHVFKTNAKGSWLVSKYVCIRMRKAKQGGSIINISSIAGINRGQLPGGVAYAASKAALNAITKFRRPNYTVTFVSRLANGMAHAMARHARSNASFFSDFSIPIFSVSIICNDSDLSA
ncbi:uncharacterized protein [Euphorbia lathyris]|uniref:uncharacterized protein isoform X2 n=1 Tax=Euphorbia lathyris TaxID=212925 RepID=UPI003313DB7C